MSMNLIPGRLMLSPDELHRGFYRVLAVVLPVSGTLATH